MPNNIVTVAADDRNDDGTIGAEGTYRTRLNERPCHGQGAEFYPRSGPVEGVAETVVAGWCV